MRKDVTGLKILKSSLEVRKIINDSIKAYRKGNFVCCYVYLHKINNVVFYVGMGAHDRAVRVAGRSCSWYKTAILEQVVVEIVETNLLYSDAEKVEQSYIKKYIDTIINLQHTDFDTIEVVQLDKKGNLIKEYNTISSAVLDGFYAGCINECCKGVRGLHKNFVWMYKTDFEEKGFQMKNAKNHARMVEQFDKEGNSIRKLNTAEAFRIHGLLPGNVQQVCTGVKKSHKGFTFKYVD